MNIIDTHNDFNLKALALGGMILLLCLLVQIFIIHYAGIVFEYSQKKHLKLSARGAAQVSFVIGAIVLLLIHLLHIYIWGYSLYLTGILDVLNTAIIFAGSTYTTVGFANDPLSSNWQILSITMATSGLFSFGISTSIMFVLAQKIFSHHTQHT